MPKAADIVQTLLDVAGRPDGHCHAFPLDDYGYQPHEWSVVAYIPGTAIQVLCLRCLMPLTFSIKSVDPEDGPEDDEGQEEPLVN